MQNAEELLEAIDKVAKDYDSYEYGLPIRIDISEKEYGQVYRELLALIRARDREIVEACKDALNATPAWTSKEQTFRDIALEALDKVLRDLG